MSHAPTGGLTALADDLCPMEDVVLEPVTSSPNVNQLNDLRGLAFAAQGDHALEHIDEAITAVGSPLAIEGPNLPSPERQCNT